MNSHVGNLKYSSANYYYYRAQWLITGRKIAVENQIKFNKRKRYKISLVR